MKGQIKLFETVGVLIVFFFLLVAGFVFYFQVQKSSIGKEIESANQQTAFNIALKAMYLPELDCSFLVSQTPNCVDKIKVDEFANLMQDDTALAFYYEEFGDARISLEQVYPSEISTSNVVLYDFKPLRDEDVQAITTQTPILIYDPINEVHNFGVLEVIRYV